MREGNTEPALTGSLDGLDGVVKEVKTQSIYLSTVASSFFPDLRTYQAEWIPSTGGKNRHTSTRLDIIFMLDSISRRSTVGLVKVSF